MKKKFSEIGSWMEYIVLYGLFKILSLFPLRMLYIFSDFVAWLAHDIVKYRRKVVTDNLRSSFPEKSEEEINDITKKFYSFLADYFVETVKLASMSPRQMRKRLTVSGIEEINNDVRAGKSVSLMLGHYCNWEWVSSLPLHIDPCARCGQIYHPLENKGSDRAFYKLRTRFHATNITMADTLKILTDWKRNGETSVVGYIADQVPGYHAIHLFLDFLHHDTPVFTGAERISRMLGASVYYADMTRPKRGYYNLKIEKITDDAAKEKRFEVTRKYFAMLERSIRRHPEYWLWSHRRWKRTREEFTRQYPDAARRLNRL